MSKACSTCRPQHADGQGDDCDHWCHGAGAEDWEALGVAHLVGGCPLEVIKAADEQVVLYEPESGYSFFLSDYGADKLRELLDRAAMPGQVSGG